MPKQQEISNSFLEGINRAVSRDEFFNPKQLYSTQNARILQTGNIGEIVRINGYSELSTLLSDLSVLYDFIRVENNFVAFYKDTGLNSYTVKIIDTNGDSVQTFSYNSSIKPTRGKLKQYDDTIFIAPHNKILYNKEGTYYLKDFVSELPKIDDISRDDLSAQKAKYDITVGNTLSSFGGKKASGQIAFYGNLLPSNTTETFKIAIGEDESDPITVKGSDSTSAVISEIVSVINSSSALSGWTASREFITGNIVNINAIRIKSDTVGDAVNGTEINFTNTDLIVQYKSGTIPSRSNLTVGQRFVRVEDIGGGVDDNIYSGILRLGFKDALQTPAIGILSTDSTSQIATKIYNVMNSYGAITNEYDVSIDGSVVTIEAVEKGKKYNTDVTVTMNINGVDLIEFPEDFITISTVETGTDADVDGTLDPDSFYWYKARFQFIDGHVTATCSPRLINSGPNGVISVQFDVVEDLNSVSGSIEYPNIQIFRKKDGDDWFLVDDVNLLEGDVSSNQYVFVDDGSPNIEPLDEFTPVWTKKHDAIEVTENRIVKGNLEFFDEEYDSPNFTLGTTSVSNGETDTAPYNSRAKIYVRPQYTDGTRGFFSELDEVVVNSTDQEITVKQNATITSPEKDIQDLRFYGRYSPFGEEQSFRFNSVDTQTPNLAGIADDQFFPAKTKIFLGYKYIVSYKFQIVSSGEIYEEFYTATKGWVREGSNFRFIGRVTYSSGNISTVTTDIEFDSDERLTINIHGEKFDYVPIAVETSNAGLIDEQRRLISTRVYQLESYQAIREAVSTNELYVTMTRTNESSLSDVESDDDILDTKVRVTGLEDKATETEKIEYIYVNIIGGESLSIPPDCRLYLTLENSILDEIDNRKINREKYLKTEPYQQTTLDDLKVAETGVLGFKLINFLFLQEASYIYSDRDAREYGKVGEYEVVEDLENDSNHAKYILINRDLTVDDQVIYLGKKDNSVDDPNDPPVTLDTTGFRYKQREALTYSRLAPYNIYDNLIKESDFNFKRTEFTNQIIWSKPLLLNNYFGGGRNYDVVDFYNLPTENGDIIDIISLQGNLIVFCERGVAKLLIGETLTQQKGGQVFVNSSQFITKHVWVLENIPPIKEDSIVKKDNQIYFTDGNDVYRLGQQVENISQGVLNLDSTIDYVGTVVNEYDEYRLSDTQTPETFVYNTKYDKWYGPYTYAPLKTVEIGENIISYIDTIVSEDTGNTFDGTSYDTVIESVGNDTQIGAIDKTYRKFYMDAENAGTSTFSYGKDYTNMEDVALSGAKVKNGYYNLGIKGTEANAKKIYWKVTSSTDGFSLKGMRTLFIPKRRR